MERWGGDPLYHTADGTHDGAMFTRVTHVATTLTGLERCGPASQLTEVLNLPRSSTK